MYGELLRRALDARNGHIEAIRAIVDSVEAEKRDLTVEERTAQDAREIEVRDLDNRIKDLMARAEGEKLADEARSSFGVAARPSGLPTENADAPKDDAAQLRSILSGATRAADFEARAFTAANAAAGGALIPTGFVNRLTEFLINNSNWAQLGVNVLETSGGNPLNIPRKTGYIAASIIGEGATLTPAEFSTDSATLHAYKFGAFSQYSTELAQDSALDIVGLIVRDHGLSLANGTGANFVAGDGNGKPQGIMVGANVGITKAATKVAATDISFDDVIGLYHSLVQGYRANGKYLTNDQTVAALRTIKDSLGRYIWESSAQVGTPDLLFGKPVVTDPNVPTAAANAKVLAFGDFGAAYTQRVVSSVRVESSIDFAFANDLVTVRSILRTDGAVLDPNAVKTLKMGTAS